VAITSNMHFVLFSWVKHCTFIAGSKGAKMSYIWKWCNTERKPKVSYACEKNLPF